MEKAIIKEWGKMEASRRKIQDLLEDAPESLIYVSPAPEVWSMAQVVYHLVQAESLTLSYCKKKWSVKDSLGQTGFRESYKLVLLKLVLSLPLKFKAPKVLGPVPEQDNLKALFQEWDRLRKDWENFLDGFSQKELSLKIFKHPKTGKMNIVQTLDFMDNHVRHHIRQVRRIRKMVASS